jgi:hypothetical protein
MLKAAIGGAAVSNLIAFLTIHRELNGNVSLHVVILIFFSCCSGRHCLHHWFDQADPAYV